MMITMMKFNADAGYDDNDDKVVLTTMMIRS